MTGLLKKGLNTGQWAFRLVFAVVVVELAIVAGSVVGCFDTNACDENDSNNIKELMQGLATKTFALYAAEKGINANSAKTSKEDGE